MCLDLLSIDVADRRRVLLNVDITKEGLNLLSIYVTERTREAQGCNENHKTANLQRQRIEGMRKCGNGIGMEET